MTEHEHEPQHPAPAPSTPAPSQQAASQPAPTPASVNGDVPVEAWRNSLEQVRQAPSPQRHELLSELLDDLDSQVGSL